MDILSKKRLIENVEPAKTRIKHNREFVDVIKSDNACGEAIRCLDCGTPFCQSGCPLGNDIPGFNRALSQEQWQQAYDLLRRTNPFPEFTGRICPAPCESACTMGLIDEPVAIEALEKTLSHKAALEGWDLPKEPKFRRDEAVAIVGSGPAGLAAAYWLNQWGYRVHVFESADELGGLLANGIPSFKLEKSIIQRRVDALKAEGIEFSTGVEIGVDVAAADLLRAFDAVLLACGASRPRVPAALEQEHQHIYLADDFLKRHIWASEDLSAALDGKTVLVLGGGDTGSDCVGTARRQGAKDIVQVEISDAPTQLPVFPRLKHPVSAQAWPGNFKRYTVSSSQEEGCKRLWRLDVQGVALDSDGFIVGVHCQDLQTNEKIEIECDVIVIAAGYLGAESQPLLAGLRLELDQKNLLPGRKNRTETAKVYTAGDQRMGASLVVNALADGRSAAMSIHNDLLQQTDSELAYAGT